MRSLLHIRNQIIPIGGAGCCASPDTHLAKAAHLQHTCGSGCPLSVSSQVKISYSALSHKSISIHKKKEMKQ